MLLDSMDTIGLGACAGGLATATMDVLTTLARRVGWAEGAKGQWVGRWYLGMARGHLFHANIAASPALPGEKRAAMAGHYVIGIVLAVVYVGSARFLGVSPSGFLVAMAYGFATCIFPWFLVFPALGFGCFGRNGPPELRLFRSSLANHAFYGLGLWWSASLLGLR